MKNHLKNQASPYLIQHADNPVDWYPWGDEAFQNAKSENKPVFLSIGYSTCHWCHVMAHESFENPEIAEILNTHFVSVKVDKEERPDIDAIYMTFCQAFTGSGGWPCSIFMTPDKKPFFAGTYFPPKSQYRTIGLPDLLLTIAREWETNRTKLLRSAQTLESRLKAMQDAEQTFHSDYISPEKSDALFGDAFSFYLQNFDSKYGGFGKAPKFPTPHNLLFLLHRYEIIKDRQALEIVEKTLMQMYRGGLFDHIGFGFSRYSTDPYFLVPHFEKMLYDNALLIFAYARAFAVTKKSVYKEIAEKTADYILREMTHPEGGFFSAQDADSEGIEGKYYLFSHQEIIDVLGEQAGESFCRQYDISKQGNFEGKNIPNLLYAKYFSAPQSDLSKLYEYRRSRMALHLDDKILTSWNGLMIAALAFLSKVTGEEQYFLAAKRASAFIEKNLLDDGDTSVLYVGCRNGIRFGKGFLDDYAFYCMGLIHLYDASLDTHFLNRAQALLGATISQFFDFQKGGFYFSGQNNERLILTPKETYDGAMPSGNSAMFYNLVKIAKLSGTSEFAEIFQKQMNFLSDMASSYPSGSSFFLFALSLFQEEPQKITVVLSGQDSKKSCVPGLPPDAELHVLHSPTPEYPLVNGKTTYYVCRNHSCLPPVSQPPSVF